MKKSGKTTSIIEKLALSCDSFTTGYLCMLLLFFVPYAASYSYIAVTAVLPLACILPFAVMPVMYSVIHRASTLMFGRYHLIMPLSAFAASLFFVFIFSSNALDTRGACFIVFGAVFFALFVLLARYCAFSVRVRLGSEGVVLKNAGSMCFSAVGGAAAVGVFCGFYFYEPATAYLNTAYVLSGVCVMLSLVQYLATFYGIPRLGGKRAESIKSVYRTFYTGLDKRVYFCVLMFEAAFFTAAALVVYLCLSIGLDMYMGITCAAALSVAFAVSSVICYKYAKRSHTRLFIVIFPCLIAAIAAIVAVIATGLGGGYAAAVIAVSSVLIGAGGGAAMRQAQLKFVIVKSKVTSGVVYILIQLTVFAAAAIAMCVAAVVMAVFGRTLSVYTFAGGFGIAAVFAVIAVSLSAYRPSKTDRSPVITYELFTENTEPLETPDGNVVPL